MKLHIILPALFATIQSIKIVRKPQSTSLLSNRFATGMNGDEDLGQDIIMKGEKFHYVEKSEKPAQGMEGTEEIYGSAIVGGNDVKFEKKNKSLI